jgi:hypothetical protein
VDIVSIKTILKSYLPVNDLIKSPQVDSIYFKLWNEYRGKIKSSILANSLSKSQIEWIDNLALETSVTLKKSAPNWAHGYLIYKIIKEFCKNSTKNQIVYFETGTAKGFSALVAAKAILDSNKKPLVISVDLLNDNRSRYWNAFGDINGRRTRIELLKNYHSLLHNIRFIKLRTQQLSSLKLSESIDICFIDGAHSYNSVRSDFEFIKKNKSSRSRIIFDDLNPNKFPGIVKFVEKLKFENQIEIHNSGFESRSYAVILNN